jgi:hypothetical protein
MAGPDPAPLRRRFVTRVDVEDAHRAGAAVTLGPTDVITHEAAQRAADLGVPVTRPERPQPPAATTSGLRPLVADPVVPAPAPAAAAAGAAPGAASAAGRHARLRAAVREAVVAELGSQPPGLEAAIDAVLARHRG